MKEQEKDEASCGWPCMHQVPSIEFVGPVHWSNDFRVPHMGAPYNIKGPRRRKYIRTVKTAMGRSL